MARRAWPLLPESCAVALLACLAPAPAQAGPPYYTDDPEPTAQGHWEAYAFASGANVAGSTSGAAGLDLNYGAAPGLQLTCVLPADVTYVDALHARAGAVELAAKYRLRRAGEGQGGLELAVFPRAFVPLAGAGRHVSLLLPVWLGWTQGGWSLFGGGGLLLQPGTGNRNAAIAGLAVTRDFGDRLDLGLEVYRQGASDQSSRDYAAVAAGMSFHVTTRWSLLASLGSGIEHAASQGRQVFYVALKGDL